MCVKLVFSVLFVTYLTFDVNALIHLDMDSDNYPFDKKVYEDALDPDLCQRQLDYLTTEDSMLLARFLDAGLRIPRGILQGNTVDLGNFHQCLGINEEVEDMVISGKYCRIRVPINQQLHWPVDRTLWKFDPSELNVDKQMLRQFEEVADQKIALKSAFDGVGLDHRLSPDSPIANVSFHLAMCVPRPCTTDQAISGLLFNLSDVGFEFEEISCRLPDDRPWVAADYVAVVVFSLIGALTLASTCYDLHHSMYLKKDSKEISTAYTSFSVYTNTRRLLTFSSGPGSLDCLDGVRALAMLWVILGHAFFTVPDTSNPIETFQWSVSARSTWVTAAPLTVDTFFFLSGLLLVYTTVGKLGRMQLLKNLHLFYLHRLLRMFPVLAAVVLFEASLYVRSGDGPLWANVAFQAAKCRQFWWSTLLHVQNIVNPREACIGVTWYLALDIQLHILSPLVLYWVLAGRRTAWTALTTTLVATLTASTVYIFHRNFPSGIISPRRQSEMTNFFIYYYVNLMTRASPFFVGMVYGYALHLWRKNKTAVPKVLSSSVLLLSLLTILGAMYCANVAMRLDWDNQLADNLFNSFQRAVWAAALGWLVLACVQGRAGPIDWFLSLRVWKLPARISYAMYLTHYSVMVVYYSSNIALVYFSVPAILFNFMAFLSITIVVSFIVTLLIDSPFSTVFKLLLGGSKKPKTNQATTEDGHLRDTKIDTARGNDNDGFEHEDTKKLTPSTVSETGTLKLNIKEDGTLMTDEATKNKYN